MDCCKETKYNLLLKFTEQQKNNQQFISEIKTKVQSIMNWEVERADQAIEFARIRENFTLLRDIRDNISKLSMKLAEAKIPHEVKLSKK